MIDLTDQVHNALKKLKADLVDNEFYLDDVCTVICRTTGCKIDEEVRRIIPGILSERHDVRPLGADGERWCFGSYTPPLAKRKKEMEYFA